MLVQRIPNDEVKNQETLDSFEVGDGIYDTETNKLYIVAHDYEEANQFPGKLVDHVSQDEDCDDYDDDDCDSDYDDDDECEDEEDEESGYEHGYFIFDPENANQVTRLHRNNIRAAIKAYFVNGLKHDFIRVPADKIKLNYQLPDKN